MLGVTCSTALTSCDNDFEYPPMVVPTATIEANTTIAEIKTQFFQPGTNNYSTVVGTKADGSHYIIEGYVTSSDESGNVFKKVYIQDETGGLYIGIDAYDLYQSYKPGQKVVLDVTGLAIGGYGAAMNIGTYNASGAPNRISEDVIGDYLQVDGLPGQSTQVEPTEISLATISKIEPNTTAGLEYQGLLVRINGVMFQNAGKETISTSGSSGVSQTFGNAEGSAVLYTSGYSDFWDYYLPTGEGDIVGILGCYGKTWQITLIDIEGLIGFDELSYLPTPDKPADPVTSLVADFEDGTIPEGWVQIQMAGDKAWYVTSFDNNYYAAMTGYKGTAPFDQWLVTPPIDMAQATSKSLTFDTQVNGYSSTTSALEVYVITNLENPEDGAVKLDANFATAPQSGYSSWANSGKIDLSKYTGKIYIAFRYTATTDANYATWCLDNVKINN